MLAEYFVVRSLDRGLLAIPLTYVTGTLAVEPSDVCPLPGVEPALMGAINLRGQLLWVLDLAAVLGRSARVELRTLSSLTLLDLEQPHSTRSSAATRSRVACMVAELVEIATIDDTAICATDDAIFARLGYPARGRSLLNGTTEYREETTVILDAEALFEALKQSHSSRSLVHS